MTTTIQIDGRRCYLVNLPFAVKDRAKSELGAKWDADRRLWWVGSAKQAQAEAFLASLSAASTAAPAAEDVSDCRAYAQVEYRGRRYYVIAESHQQGRCRLTTLDGMTPFWVDMSDCNLVRTYEGRRRFAGYGRGEVTVYPTIGSLRAFRDQQRDPATARGECTECGHWGPRGHRCTECGGEGCHA